MNNLLKYINESQIMPEAKKNLIDWLNQGFLPDWALLSLTELFQKDYLEEINDRFFQIIAFGTGGMRGRTIGKKITSVEMGIPDKFETPAHPAVGTNNMNDFTVLRSTIGLFKYCKAWHDSTDMKRPSLVIAYDVRHFSPYFCKLVASAWKRLGGDVYVFDGARSTPQLSFTVRKLKATAGIVLTASHNPSHDNGYKVYFSDGAQITSPHAEGIVKSVNQTAWSEVKNFLNIDVNNIQIISKNIEDDYIKAIEDSVIDKKIMEKFKPSIVFSAVHGTGASLCPSVMKHFGLSPILVDEQMIMDPRFPTVKQPNPEYAETLSMAVKKADDVGADCVVATDPDADRMGVAIRNKNGGLQLLTGNMIGSILAYYRASRMKDLGIVTNPKNSALIKTFVTTPLQDSIAEFYGLKCINTLTGFKWIGRKLREYEEVLVQNTKVDYDKLSYLEKAKLLQEKSTFFVFGGEESYGYLATDSVRDKDANAAVIMWAEMLAYLKSCGKTVDQYLDEIYLRCGYYLEDLLSVYKEGASGSVYIQNFLEYLNDKGLDDVDGVKVISARNFAKDSICDADGIEIPKEKFFFYKLENGYSFAIRGSGTEPKMKFYAFAKEEAKDEEGLRDAKFCARKKLTSMLEYLNKLFGSYAE